MLPGDHHGDWQSIEKRKAEGIDSLPALVDLVHACSFQQPLFKNGLITGLNALELDARTRIGFRIDDSAPRLETSLTSGDFDRYRGSLRQWIRHFYVAAIQIQTSYPRYDRARIFVCYLASDDK